MIEPSPLVIRHEKSVANPALLDISDHELSSSNILQKLNSTIFSKSKTVMESINYCQSIKSTKNNTDKENKQLIGGSGKGAVPGLKFNCLDSICTKQNLDMKTSTNTLLIKEI